MTFDLQPILAGDKVYIRPLRAEDYDGMFAAASDPLIWEQHPDKNRHEPKIFRAYFEDALASKGALVIIDRETDELIGSSRFHGFDPVESKIEIGWTFLVRRCWGGAYNSEIKTLMLQHAFKAVQHVIFLVGPENLRSQKALEKIGGVRIADGLDGAGRLSFAYRISA